ncbi:MAG: hypothetical protein WC887_03005 [Candidatus Paceibacterota bacterium]|jgi:hypothetical protein
MAMKKNKTGFALLVAVIFMTVMLTLGLAISSIGYKQQVLASTAIQSQYAFYAADTALECALYIDQKQQLFLNPPSTLTCSGIDFSISTTTYSSGHLTWLKSDSGLINLDGNRHCAQLTVYKYYSSISGQENGTTYIFAQGYDVSCSTVNTSGARFVSRGINARYVTSVTN